MVPSKVLNRTLIRNLILVAMLAGLIFAVKAHELSAPIGKDAGTFLYVADQWLDGALPYRDSLADNKPPGIYLTIAAALALSRRSILGVRLFEVLWSFLASLGMFALVRRLFRPATAWLVAFLFAILSNVGQITQGGLLTEYYMLLPLIVGANLIVSWAQKPSSWKLIAIGTSAGIACLYKPVAVFDLVAFSLVVAWASLRHPARLRYSIVSLCKIGLGFVLPIALSILYFALNGALADYYNANVYTLLMEKRWTWETAKRLVATTYCILSGGLLTATVLTAISFVLLLLRRIPRTLFSVFPFIWLGFATMGALSGGLGFGHYFMQLVPAMCLCAAPAIESVTIMKARDKRGRHIVSNEQIALGLIVLALLWTSALDTSFRSSVRLMLEGPREPTAEEVVASYIQAHTDPDDYIYSWSSGGPIYFLANRRSSTRWFGVHVTGRYMPSQTTLNDTIRASFIADVIERPPRFFVFWSGTDADVAKLLEESVPQYLPFFRSHYERIEVEGIALYRLEE